MSQKRVTKLSRNLSPTFKIKGRHWPGLRIISRHPFAVPFMTLGILIVLTGSLYFVGRKTNHVSIIPNSKIVIISHDHLRQTVPSREPTVGALLHKLNINIGQGDVVEPSLSAAIDQEQFRINIYRAVPVQIVDGSNIKYTFSAATTARSIVEQTGMKLYAEDYVDTNPAENFVKYNAVGERVVIDRSLPINLNLYGAPLTLRTHANTVAELIKQEKIHIDSTDQILPGLNSALSANTEVFIVRNGTKIESVNQPIVMPIQTISDPTLAFGTSALRQQGSAGQQVITYQDQLKNGKVVGRTIIQTIITQQPVTEIVVEGTSLSGIKGDMALAGIAPGDYNYADYIMSHESGWCPTKAQGEHYCPALPDNQFTPNGYGLCQATPGIKMSSAGADWATNPVTQLRWCAGYAEGRYGSWYNAYNHWMEHSNW